ncbi:protein PAL OF QUIRKY isoform X2 [Quercus suber]|uniref:protein PAL OF QUIRKY isoform X2 n=1 Tax=Quercus suber TaxID=58331 RepID=UPI000CE233D5|nr:uncharacterized protein LOC112002334 isoform X2 [Quercus suber]POE63779.1 hypothetical protein CFP56_26605 [Quercus suber]
MDQTPPSSTTKLRLMCSYGGNIIPNPRTNSLHYVGGDTKIISLNPTATATLSSLTSLLSSTLSLPFPLPFSLKYLLPPHHDLSSLIPLLSDSDLLLFLHHLLCLSSSPSSSRIRLFLFRLSVIHHPKTELWFSDALKSAKINMTESFSAGELSNGTVSNAESIVLETSSSFGSTSSSASSSSTTNLSSIKAQVEDSKLTLPSSDSFTSDNSATSAISQPQSITCQDPVVQVSSMENNVSSKPLELQQQVQFVQVGANYIPHNSTGVLPNTSCYTMYPAQPLQQFHYQPNQLCPVYFVPVGQMPPYSLPVQCGLVNTVTAPNQPPMCPNASLIAPQVAYKEAPVAPAKPDLPSQFYRTSLAHVAAPLVPVPVSYYENQQQPVGIPQMHHQPQSIPIPSHESAKFNNELDDDPARVQIYKSQPPPPLVPSQYQTMTKATANLLSEALAQLHKDNLKQEIRPLQQQ